jgi:multiple sugar transport system permease protein
MHGSAVRFTGADIPIGQASSRRRSVGRWLILAGSAIAVILILLQVTNSIGWTDIGAVTWQRAALAVLAWFVIFDIGVVLRHGIAGERVLFLLPAVQITVAFVLFPTIFGLYVAFTDWNLSSASGRTFNGLANFRALFNDGDFWRSMLNMVYYLGGVLVQYVIAFGLALLLNQDIRGRKFFRLIFLLPFMLSPVAVSFMIGRSLLDSQFGPIGNVLASVGIENVTFWEEPWPARINIMIMDAWYSIPFVMVLLLAGLQAIPHEVLESSRIDGATARQTFFTMIYPLMLPVSLTAVVLRIIFELKLIDIVRVVTNGNPGGATDTVTLFIFREGIEQANVGYATALSQFYLVCVIILVTLILVVAGRWVQKFS